MRIFITVIIFLLSTSSWAQLSADKTVLITGANRGIGFGFVEYYVGQGWNVIATARNPKAAADLHAIQKRYANLVIEQLDVTDHQRINDLASKYENQPIDVLVNNAGIRPLTRGGEVNFEDARRMFDVNVWGPVKMAHSFMDNVAKSDDKKIINISSVVASIELKFPKPMMLNYRASKAALNSYMAGIATGGKEAGIIISLLHPGGVDTSPEASCPAPPAPTGGMQRICVEESITQMMEVINGLTLADNGKFYSYTGDEIAW